MIPVLGVPILTHPELLDEMIRSIDVEVGQLVVIDNGGVIPDPYWNADVIRPGRNLGVAASWNLILQSYPDAPWWMIAGFDVVFSPGDLERLTRYMEAGSGLHLLGSFTAFGLDRATVERVGTFDENFHPAYFEDNDYAYRCRLIHVPVVNLPTHLVHRNSSTIKLEPAYRIENHRTYPMNRDYYLSKWGGLPDREIARTPFNRGGSVRDWTLNERRLRRLAWKVEP